MARFKIGIGDTAADTVSLGSGDILFVEIGARLSIPRLDPAVRLIGGLSYINCRGAVESFGTAIFGDDAATKVNVVGGLVQGLEGAGIAISSGTLELSIRGGAVSSFTDAAIAVGGTVNLRNFTFGTIEGKLGVRAAGGSIVNDTRAAIEGRTFGILIDDGTGGPVDEATRIINFGTINAPLGPAIKIIGDGDDRIVNHGTIDSNNTNVGIDTGAGNDRVINSGTIFNAVLLGDGDDLFINTGTFFRWVDGGAGDDQIDAGPGNSRIIGGLGRDILTGGAGSDSFEFNTVADSGSTLATADRITDFDKASGDSISLSQIDADTTTAGNQAFSNIGATAFTGQAGELRVVAVAASVAVYGDTDGDAIADFALLLVGLTDPSATQFFL